MLIYLTFNLTYHCMKINIKRPMNYRSMSGHMASYVLYVCKKPQ